MANPIDPSSASSTVTAHRPWPRREVDADGWRAATGRLVAGEASLLALWGDTGRVHMALLTSDPHAVEVVDLACPTGAFPSVGRAHAPAIRFERTIHDLFGLEATDAADRRPWLDHGVWPHGAPLGADPAVPGPPPAYAFLPSIGAGLHRIPVGPVHAGIIEPGHFRFTCGGETVVRLEERLGYTHKGIEAAMAGRSFEAAAAFAARLSGDSTVAASIAYARAVEAALDRDVPERAHCLRALMAELERVADHLGDIGAICNDAAFAVMLAQCSVLRERVLRACRTAFGHRLMMDAVVPGGTGVDLDAAGTAALRGLTATIREALPSLIELYEETASLQDRTVGTGILKPELARLFACGGFVGRASGRSFDTRRDLPYPPYDRLRFEVPVFEAGDVDARVWVRIREVEQSLTLIGQILAKMPTGPIAADLRDRPSSGGEGLALVEGFRGDILAWVRLAADGTVERCHLRDPSWLQWPLLEAAIEGNIVADFPLCNKSFNCSYSGHDL